MFYNNIPTDFTNMYDDYTGLFFRNPLNILDRNIILNFLGQIEFELGTAGFSSTANKIAEFYVACHKSSSGIALFFSNSVIKFIKEQIKHNFKLKNYLNERFFTPIEEERLRYLNYLYRNSEHLTKAINKKIKKQSKKRNFITFDIE
jgi:hypothetical protein